MVETTADVTIEVMITGFSETKVVEVEEVIETVVTVADVSSEMATIVERNGWRILEI